MRILVTGASGYIGMKMCRSLSGKKEVRTIVGLDMKEPGFSPEKFIFYNRDVRQPVDDIIKKHSIDVKGLEADTIYYYQSVWIDSDGNQGKSDTLSFKTSPVRAGIVDIGIQPGHSPWHRTNRGYLTLPVIPVKTQIEGGVLGAIWKRVTD